GRNYTFAIAYERAALDQSDIIFVNAAIGHCIVTDPKCEHPVSFVRADHECGDDHRTRLKVFTAAVLAMSFNPVDLANRGSCAIHEKLERKTAVNSLSHQQSLFFKRLNMLRDPSF